MTPFRPLYRWRRGIFLIGVLVTTVLITMFVGAAISLVPAAFNRTGKSGELISAYSAAMSGIEYAVARLQKDPQWRAQAAYEINEPDLTVREAQGNVVGLVIDSEGQVSQFRFRFNMENGTPANDPDQLADSTAPMTIDYAQVSYNNVVSSGDFTLPAVGGVPAVTVPARSLYLAVEGRSGPGCGSLTAASFNDPLTSQDFSRKCVRTVFKLNNIGQPVAAASAMAAGKFSTGLTSDPTDKLELSSQAGPPGLRSKDNIQVTSGSSQNLVATTSGEYRVPVAASPVYNGVQKLTRKDEAPSDNFYSIRWSDVRRADGTNTLAAGTYVWFDDGSLHYYDMAPADYISYASANPLDNGTTVYLQSEGLKALRSGVNVTSTGNGAGMRSRFVVHQDTQVTAAVNTTELGILPRKGAAEQPAPAGSGTGTTAEFQTAMLGAITPTANPEKWTLNPAALAWMDAMATWASANGYGEYQGYSSWEGNNVELKPGAAQTEIEPGAWGSFQNTVNAYLAANPAEALTLPGVTFASGALPPGTASGAVAASLVEPKNIEMKLEHQDKKTSVVLSSDGSITVGAVLKGTGASLVSAQDLRLIGLGVDLSATPNASEGVSFYAGNNIHLSTLDLKANKFQDVKLKGVVYALGDVTAILGAPTYTSAADWGKFSLTGVLIAYGGDPSLTAGSDPTKGRVSLTARSPKLQYDAAYLGNLLQSIPLNASYGRHWWVVE